MMNAEDIVGQSFAPQSIIPQNGLMSENLVMWQLQSQEIIEDISHQLKGEVFDFVKKKWVIKGTPLMNDDGIASLATTILGVVNRNIILSGLEEEEIRNFTLDQDFDTIDDVTLNFDSYGMKENDVIMSRTLQIIEINVFAALKRAKADSQGVGATQRFLTTTQRYSETNVIGRQPPPTAQTEKQPFWAGLFKR